jgi:hypothetical protein
MSVTVGSLPLSKLSVGASKPAFFCRLVYLGFEWGSALPPLLGRACRRGRAPPSFSRAQDTPPSLLHVFFLFAYCSFFFFCRVGVSLSRGLCWFFLGVAVGVLHVTYLLTCWCAKQPSACAWWCGSPPSFSIYRGMGKLWAGWGCRGVRVLPLLCGFSCPMCL